MPASPSSIDPFENWFDFRLQLAWVYDGPVGPYRKHEYLAHPISAWLIREGTVKLRFASGKEDYQAGNWVFPRAEDGQQEFSQGARILSVRFVAEWPTGEFLYDRSRSRSKPADELSELTRIGERLARYVGGAFPGVTVDFRRMPGSPQRYFGTQRLLHGWMLAYSAAMEKLGLAPHLIEQLDVRVRDALHLMEMRPLNHPLREKELADSVGLSISQLNKLFMQDLGRSPTEVWEEKRVRMARLALLGTERDIKSIAYSLGFSSLPHFSSWVTKKFGHSPRTFRKLALERNS